VTIGKIWGRVVSDVREYRFGLLALLVYYILMRLVFHGFCPMVILTGMPCPGCGLSRSVLFLLLGQFARSFLMHPLGLCWLMLIFYFGLNRYILGRRVGRGFVACTGVVVVATLVLYGYRMVTSFPGSPPMSYTGNNVLERLIPGYRGRILSFFWLYR